MTWTKSPTTCCKKIRSLREQLLRNSFLPESHFRIFLNEAGAADWFGIAN